MVNGCRSDFLQATGIFYQKIFHRMLMADLKHDIRLIDGSITEVSEAIKEYLVKAGYKVIFREGHFF